MLLKDCPVWSVVRLVSFCGRTDHAAHNLGFSKGTFVVFERNGEKFIKDGHGYNRYEISDDADYQFEIVSLPNTPNNHARQITLDGVTYKLTLAGKRKTIEIDGVEYYMEPA